MGSDSVVEADPTRDLLDVGADLFTKVRNLVNEGDSRRCCVRESIPSGKPWSANANAVDEKVPPLSDAVAGALTQERRGSRGTAAS